MEALRGFARRLPVAALDSMVDRINLSTLLSTKSSKQSTATGADIVRGYCSWDLHALIRSVNSVLFDRTSVIDALLQIVVPTLLVSGEQDMVLPTAFRRRIAARLQRSKFVKVLEAAHLIPLEQPDLANRLIGEFLQHLPEYIHSPRASPDPADQR